MDCRARRSDARSLINIHETLAETRRSSKELHARAYPVGLIASEIRSATIVHAPVAQRRSSR